MFHFEMKHQHILRIFSEMCCVYGYLLTYLLLFVVNYRAFTSTRCSLYFPNGIGVQHTAEPIRCVYVALRLRLRGRREARLAVPSCVVANPFWLRLRCGCGCVAVGLCCVALRCGTVGFLPQDMPTRYPDPGKSN